MPFEVARMPFQVARMPVLTWAAKVALAFSCKNKNTVLENSFSM
jgi:hypothetical protein